MSKAPDVRFGERKMEVALAEIHRARLAGVRAGTWPQLSIDTWLRLAAQAEEHLAGGRPIDDTLEWALEVAAAHRDSVAA